MSSVVTIELTYTNENDTMWMNFKQYCDSISRPMEHVMMNLPCYTVQWNCLNTEFVLLGRYDVSQIQRLVKVYVDKYVICSCCQHDKSEFEYQPGMGYIFKCLKCLNQKLFRKNY